MRYGDYWMSNRYAKRLSITAKRIGSHAAAGPCLSAGPKAGGINLPKSEVMNRPKIGASDADSS